MSKKPYIYTVYSSGVNAEKFFTECGAVFTKQNVLNDFHGVEFTIQPFRGKGSQQKNRELEKYIYSIR